MFYSLIFHDLSFSRLVFCAASSKSEILLSAASIHVCFLYSPSFILSSLRDMESILESFVARQDFISIRIAAIVTSECGSVTADVWASSIWASLPWCTLVDLHESKVRLGCLWSVLPITAEATSISLLTRECHQPCQATGASQIYCKKCSSLYSSYHYVCVLLTWETDASTSKWTPN